jgi:hypothetical protein
MNTNLELYFDARTGIEERHRASFDAFLIGALSNGTPEERWREAIETALECCAKYHGKPEQENEPHEVSA